MTGIYLITNRKNGNCYVGQSIDIKRRWQKHISQYSETNAVYSDYYIYRAMRKYGLDSFQFEVLEQCEKDMLTTREQYYYDKLKPAYNMIYPEQGTPYAEVRQTHLQACKDSWIIRDEESKQKTLKNLKLGIGSRKPKKSIIAIHIKTNKFFEFDTMLEAEQVLGTHRSSISQILNPNHKRKTSKGFTFEII